MGVSENANGQVRAMFGRQVQGLAAEVPAIAPRVTDAQALAPAKRATLGNRLLAMRVEREESRQMNYVHDNDRSHLSSAVTFFAASPTARSTTVPGGNTPERTTHD